MQSDIRIKYDAIRDEAGRLAGHPVKVIAVTKNFPVDLLKECIQSGIYCIGENKIQEAVEKFKNLENELRRVLEFHFIGTLQSNKARFIPGVFQYVHSVGTESALLKLEQANQAFQQKSAEKIIKADDSRPAAEKLKILIQFNVSGEKSKSGFSPEDPGVVAELLSGCKNLDACGLMTVGPLECGVEDTRFVFRGLRKIRDEMNKKYNLSLTELSMGMSDDYRIACEEGATMIRLGSILFGSRPGY